MKRLARQVAVVTGAYGGIGKSLSLRLAAEGASVCLVGRRADRLAVAVRGVAKLGGRCTTYAADLALESDIKGLKEYIEGEFGSLNVLVHSAGVIALGRLDELGVEDLDRLYRVNVRAAYMLTCALLPMLKAHQGQIVFMNSSMGLTARAGIGHYAASKHALKAITDSLREEINPDGVRVLSVFLGRTASPIQAKVFEVEGRPYRPGQLIQPQDVAAVVADTLCLPRTVEVTEIRMRPMKKT